MNTPGCSKPFQRKEFDLQKRNNWNPGFCISQESTELIPPGNLPRFEKIGFHCVTPAKLTRQGCSEEGTPHFFPPHDRAENAGADLGISEGIARAPSGAAIRTGNSACVARLRLGQWAGRKALGVTRSQTAGRSSNGRDDWIRTSDLCVPNAALYQAEPRPDRTGTAFIRKISFCLDPICSCELNSKVLLHELPCFSGFPGFPPEQGWRGRAEVSIRFRIEAEK